MMALSIIAQGPCFCRGSPGEERLLGKARKHIKDSCEFYHFIAELHDRFQEQGLGITNMELSEFLRGLSWKQDDGWRFHSL